MSRIASWIDKDDMERKDVAALMQDDMVDIKLLRFNKFDSDDGFRKQQARRELELVKVIKGRVDRRTQIYRAQDSQNSKSVDHLFIATVYYRDVRVGDRMELPGVLYTVKFINQVAQSFSEVELEVSE